MYSSAAKATNAFLHIQDFARNAAVVDRKIGFGIHLDGDAYSVGGTYFGSLDTFNNKVGGFSIQCLVVRVMLKSDRSNPNSYVGCLLLAHPTFGF